MKIILAALVLALFGTVCSSYAIDCTDVWDEESIAEMMEDDRKYEEWLRAGHHHDAVYGEQEHDVHHEQNDDAGQAESSEEDEAAHVHDGEHGQHGEATNVAHSAEKHRQQRDAPLLAEEQPVAGQLLEEEPSDLETAETHLFRPVFRYKSQYTERRRVRAPNGGGGANFAPTQS
ncbi:uncharacterized protein LOC120893538 [Anopheles arabiensis]|uniref:Secreted protein n=1 Tax=Anopheles arabiensis TaxID=7173 RepID=A0A182HMG5_ANOAR|nr:uncharacterized protein LOC120893538 [Anopheles arabiensis]